MPLRIVHVGELHPRNASCIVDEYMDGAESLYCLRDQSLDVRQLLNIARHCQQLSTGFPPMLSRASARRGSRLAHRTTRTPSCAKAWADAYPIPSLEPVTIATFPCNPRSIVSPPALHCSYRSGIAEMHETERPDKKHDVLRRDNLIYTNVSSCPAIE